jgi:hypothetical protein
VITCLHYPSPASGTDRVLLIMLPGAGIQAGAFAERGMVAALHARALPIDIVAAQPPLELYLDGGVADALHAQLVAPARAQGYQRIWMLGISLGGLGALLYASAHPGVAPHVILLAPFLGTPGTIAEITKAGGLHGWADAGSTAVAIERRALRWLRDYLEREPDCGRLCLGYGTEDRFAPAHRMLAREMPAEAVVTQPGGHEWETWLALWPHLLDRTQRLAAADLQA